MATFLVTHGAWSAGFVWKKMRPLLREKGHQLFTPSHTGLGDRLHLANPAIDLETHISDILAVLFHEDLHDVFLVGHSYGGIVATGVADRAPGRIAEIIYLDAIIGEADKSMFDLVAPDIRQRWQDGARTHGDGWRIPSNPLPPDTSAEDVAWITPRRHPQPIKTFSQALRLGVSETHLPRTYIYCTRIAPSDMFGPFAKRTRSTYGWRYLEMDASHSPHVTAPDVLAVVLHAIANKS